LEGSQWPKALPRPANQRLRRLDGATPWFEVYEVCDGTFALLEPRHYEEVISYLIVGDDRALLLDTGMGIGDIQVEVERLTRLPIIVVNSHSHYDHVGDNHRFSEVWAFDAEGELARIEGGLGPEKCVHHLAPGSYLDLPPDFDPQTYTIRPSAVTRRLHHLDTIALGGRTLSVHHTPGHSPGSLCLLDERNRLLFTGDTFYPGMLYAHFPDSDLDCYIQSLRYLVGLLDHVDHLCPAHNEAYVPKEMLIRALDSFERIAAGKASFEIQDGIRVYRFEGFGVTLPYIDEHQ
jgi:glyoxylase-like metal-dependent hydrolase (beta-lactamase superfamily II)